MPEIDLDPNLRKSTGQDFEKFKLKKGEVGRGVLLQKPVFAWVHTLRAPQIVNGKAVMVKKERTDRQGNVIGAYTDYATDWIGRPQCLGDYGILADKGVDAANCPVCKRSVETADEVGPPERRFAVNLIRYATKADGSPITPFSCACLVWGFSEGTFNKLLGLAAEYGELLGRDLVFGPCINEGWQNFEVKVGARDLWKLNDEIRNRVVETFKLNKVVEGLEEACGRKSELKWILRDLDNVAFRWKMARGNADQADGTEGADAATLTAGLDTLLADSGAASVAEPVDLAGLLAADTTVANTTAANDLPPASSPVASPVAEPVPATPSPAAGTAPTTGSTPVVNVADLLGDTAKGTEANTAPVTAPAAPAPTQQQEPDDFTALLAKLG